MVAYAKRRSRRKKVGTEGTFARCKRGASRCRSKASIGSAVPPAQKLRPPAAAPKQRRPERGHRNPADAQSAEVGQTEEAALDEHRQRRREGQDRSESTDQASGRAGGDA